MLAYAIYYWYILYTSCSIGIMSHFDERSGVEYCHTPWGQWGQTIEEVYVEVNVPEGTRSKDIRCDLKPKSICVTVNKEIVIKV